MGKRPYREAVDLDAYPDLVIVYLGMKAQNLRAAWKIFRYGPRISRSVEAEPDGLLRHEMVMYDLVPHRLHIGMRQYWQDFEALERWTRSAPHADWWKDLHGDSTGTGLWHEAYFKQGGIDALYLDVPGPVGLKAFCPPSEARGSMFSARRRAGYGGEEQAPAPNTEDVIYPA